MKRQFGVIGLGRFGRSVAKHLAALGQDVLAIDFDEERVREVDTNEFYCVQANANDKRALREIGLQNVDTVIVAIGKDIEASILATMICKELGIRRIIAKADNEVHAQVLQHIGVDQIVFPEEEMGARLAHRIITGVLMDYIDVAPNVSIMEVQVSPAIAGKKLSELQWPRKYGVTVLAVKRGDEVAVPPSGDTILQRDDVMVLLGARDAIERLR